jgi:hypothetical protein
MVKVKITNPNHPHYGEVGNIKVNEKGNVVLKRIGTKEMFKIKLNNCLHGVSECYVTKMM